MSSGVSVPKSSGSDKARSSRICLGLKRNGMPDCETELSYGGNFDWLASTSACGLSPNGATRHRRAEKAESGLGYALAARTVVRLLTLERSNLTKAQTMTIAAIEESLPDLVEARDVVDGFHEILRHKSKDELDAWIDRATKSLVASFANGVILDGAAVQNAITSKWSNGQTEGQITKLKLVKRQMYGRGKLDLLEARVVGAS